MRDDEVFLDVHQVVDAHALELWELAPAFGEERGNVVPFLALPRKLWSSLDGLLTSTLLRWPIPSQ